MRLSMLGRENKVKDDKPLEVEESGGTEHGKTRRMQKYLTQFPRHRAFKSEMQAVS